MKVKQEGKEIHDGKRVKTQSGSLQEDSPSHLATMQNKIAAQFQLGSYTTWTVSFGFPLEILYSTCRDIWKFGFCSNTCFGHSK